MGGSAGKRSADLGSLTLQNGILRYEPGLPPYCGWALRIDEIRVVGEYSTDNGPYIEDLFCVFVVNETTWHEVPYDALGVREAIATMAGMLRTDLTFQLLLSTEFRSRVIWPEHLRDVALFEFREVRRRFWDMLLRWGCPGEVESVLSPRVLAYIGGA
jgi:hypothetical protein